MVEIKDLMMQTAETVYEQGEIVGIITIFKKKTNIVFEDLISTNIEITKKNADGAVKEIKKANETSKKMKKWLALK